jgi:hypothetical protein
MHESEHKCHGGGGHRHLIIIILVFLVGYLLGSQVTMLNMMRHNNSNWKSHPYSYNMKDGRTPKNIVDYRQISERDEVKIIDQEQR